MPDLIAVVGEGGVRGYAYKEELMGSDESPESPEEALRLQAQRTSHYITIYESDGETPVGRFFFPGPDDQIRS